MGQALGLDCRKGLKGVFITMPGMEGLQRDMACEQRGRHQTPSQ